MGLNLKPLVIREKTKLESFANKIVAIDAYNAIYQFLATIRGPDGMNLTDSQGRITSHLGGLFYRNINFLSIGIKPIYVFDGKAPSLKSAEIERRRRGKKDATVKYEKALSEGRMDEARKYAQQTTTIRDGMIEDAKKLLELFGIPYVDAPGEGEAMAAYLTNVDHAHASASQDYDSVLFGAKKLVRNFTNSGRRKIPNKNAYVEIEPEIIETEKCLAEMKVTQEQLVDIGILIGTDFNPDGFERIGPKTALKVIRQYKRLEDIPSIQEKLSEIDYEQIRKIFLEPEVGTIDEIKFERIDYDGISSYMIDEREFSANRATASLNRLKKSIERKSQTLEQWFG